MRSPPVGWPSKGTRRACYYFRGATHGILNWIKRTLRGEAYHNLFRVI